jgi:hypothetical protein
MIEIAAKAKNIFLMSIDTLILVIHYELDFKLFGEECYFVDEF